MTAGRPTLGIIPARRGSKRLPGKNTRPFGGKPLVEWAIEAALGSTVLDRLVVSSDDPEVLAIAAGFAGVIGVRRPVELAADDSPAIDYVRHALDQSGSDFSAVAVMQPTSPLMSSGDIDDTVSLLHTSGADAAVTVFRARHELHPVKQKRLVGDRLLPYFDPEVGRMREQDLPSVYVRNGAVYASQVGTIAEGRIVGEDCRAIVVPQSRSIDIDEQFDFDLAEFLLKKYGHSVR